MRFRKAVLADCDAVLALLGQYEREPDPPPERVDVEKAFAEFDRGPGGIFVAETADRWVGTFQLIVSPQINHSARPFALIENVIVDRDVRRQGIGKRMMREAVRMAETCNCSKIYLTSGAHRPDNHTFYAACGFNGNKIGFQIKF